MVDVARAEHAGNIGRHVFARKDVALVIEGDRILEPFVVRGLAEEDENPVHGQRGAFAGLRVFEDGGGQLAVRDFHVHDLGRLEALHAGVLRGLRREEAIHDFHHGQLGDAEIQEVQAFVEGAVPAADHEHALAFVRSAVADRAEVHLIAFGGHVQRNGLAARRQNDRRGLVNDAVPMHGFLVFAKLKAGDFEHFLHFHAHVIHMFAHLFHEFHTVDLRIGGKILHRIRRIHQPARHIRLEEHHIEVRAFRVDRRRHPGRPAAQYDDVTSTFFHCKLLMETPDLPRKRPFIKSLPPRPPPQNVSAGEEMTPRLSRTGTAAFSETNDATTGPPLPMPCRRRGFGSRNHWQKQAIIEAFIVTDVQEKKTM